MKNEEVIERLKNMPLVPDFKLDPTFPIPFGKSILVSRMVESKEENKTASGLIIPDSVNTGTNSGVIIATGPEVSEHIRPGMHVLFSSYANNEILIEKKGYLLMYETDVYAAIPPKAIVLMDSKDEKDVVRAEKFKNEQDRLNRKHKTNLNNLDKQVELQKKEKK